MADLTKISGSKDTVLSRFAKTLNPLIRKDTVAKAEARTAKQLKKLAKDMAKGKTTMKIRRSRLPLVVALLVLLVGAGGFLLYRSISMPKVHVTHVARKWLDSASGQEAPKAHHAAVHQAHKHSKHKLARHGKHKHHKLAHHKKHGKARLAHKHKKKHTQTARYAE